MMDYDRLAAENNSQPICMPTIPGERSLARPARFASLGARNTNNALLGRLGQIVR
jgi:hypothetical protein